LKEQVQLVTVDASFISLRVLLPVLRAWLTADGQVVALVKPQFEAGREEVGRGDGVIRNVAVHRRVLDEVLTCAVELRLEPRGLIRSPLLGPKGNVEFLIWLGLLDGDTLDDAWKTWIVDVTEKLICV
jgi:23S rRNA (cytidine1920-2'-O)/16S rRNA (cytidine1409-2'-O)-methyltransferase